MDQTEHLRTMHFVVLLIITVYFLVALRYLWQSLLYEEVKCLSPKSERFLISLNFTHSNLYTVIGLSCSLDWKLSESRNCHWQTFVIIPRLLGSVQNYWINVFTLTLFHLGVGVTCKETYKREDLANQNSGSQLQRN